MENSEIIPPRKKPLVIFGQGPVIDTETKVKAKDNPATPGTESLHMWGEGLINAAAVLHQRKTVGDIIVLGGQTGGDEYKSEAELVKRGLVAKGIPEGVIDQETRSRNTFENLVNVCNDFLDRPGAEKTVDMLGAPYHLTRMKVLMKLFAIPYENVFATDEVMRFAARDNKPAEEWDHPALSEIERKLDINAAGRMPVSEADKKIPGYYDTKSGEEQRTILRRVQEEEVWMRALVTMPEYYLCYLGQIKDSQRLHKILANVEMLSPGVLEEKRIYVGLDDDDTIRAKLSGIQRKMPNADAWIEEHKTQGLPDGVVDKIQNLLNSK